MVKEDVVHLYTVEYYSAVRKIMPFAGTWMGLEIVILSEVSQREKDKHHMISLTCESKKGTNEPIYKTEAESDIENKFMVTRAVRVARDKVGVWD